MAAKAPTFSAAGAPSFCAPAQVRILLVPAEPLDVAEFERWASYVRAWERFPLVDVPRARAPPPAHLFRQAEVHVSFVTTYTSAHEYLVPFQVHRGVHGVLGLGTYDAAAPWERLGGMLRAEHPHALAHRVMAFDTHARAHGASAANGDMADAAMLGGDDAEFVPPSAGFRGRKEHGLLVVPAIRQDAKDVRFYLRTLLAELVGHVLDQLDLFAQQLDDASLETPRETLASPALRLKTERWRDAPPLPPRPATAAPSGASKMFGRKRAAPAPAPPTLSLRAAKVQADVALLSGLLWDALEGYSAILTPGGKDRALAGGQDAVWFAGALEGWAVARTLVARLGGDAEAHAPGLLYPLTLNRDKETRDPTPAPQAWRDVTEAYAAALAIYAKCLAPPQAQLERLRSLTHAAARDYTPPLVYASACLQYARFLLALYASGGWTAEAFDQLLCGGVPPALDTGVPLTFREQAHLSAVSGIYRYEVGAAISAALTPSLPLLPPGDQISVLASMYRMLEMLDLRRRAAHIARCLGAVVSTMLVTTTRERASLAPPPSEALDATWARARAAPGDAPPPARPTLGLDDTALWTHANPALVLGLVACDAYGIDILSTPLLHVPPTHMLEQARRRVCAHAYTDMLASALGVEQARAWLPALSRSAVVALRARAPFGWTSLQTQLLKDLVVQCEHVADHVAQVFFAALLLRDAQLPPTEHAAWLEGMRDALAEARAHGAPQLMLRYWGPRDVLQAMELCAPPPASVPVLRAPVAWEGHDLDEPGAGPTAPGGAAPAPTARDGREKEPTPPASQGRSTSEPTTDADGPASAPQKEPASTPEPPSDAAPAASAAPTAAAAAAARAPAPSPASPARARLADRKAVPSVADVVAGEPMYVDVTLRNPLSMPLPFTELALLTEGAEDVEPSTACSTPLAVTVAPRALQTVRLAATPREPGPFHVLGCRARLWGADVHDLVLASREARAPDAPAAHGAAARAVPRLLRAAAAAPDLAALEAKLRPAPRPLAVRVLPQQPRLAAHVPTWGPMAKMLLHGQVLQVPLRLTNTSDFTVDYVRCEMDDPVRAPIRDAVVQGSLMPADAHDLEWQLVHRPVLQCATSAAPVVAPRASVDVPLLIHARHDCDWARVRVWYGAQGSAARGARLPLRCVPVTLPWSVEPSWDVAPLHVQPLAPDAARRLAASWAPAEDMPPCVLVRIDVLNASAALLRLDLEVEGVPGTTWTQSRSVLPGASTRISVPWVPRVDGAVARATPIPALTPRQYIVPKVALSDDEKAQHQWQFWARDALLRGIRARWTEPASLASGTLDLHALWPSPAHAALLSHAPLAVEITAAAHAAPGALCAVSVDVRGAAPAAPLQLELEAHAPTAAQCMVADGTWHEAWDQTGASLSWLRHVCFLAEGPWTLVAHAATRDAPDAPWSRIASSRPWHIDVRE